MQKAVQLYIVKMYVVCPLSYFMLCFLILQGNFAMSGYRDACSKHHSYHFLDEITVTLNWTLPAKKARHRNFNKKRQKEDNFRLSLLRQEPAADAAKSNSGLTAVSRAVLPHWALPYACTGAHTSSSYCTPWGNSSFTVPRRAWQPLVLLKWRLQNLHYLAMLLV